MVNVGIDEGDLVIVRRQSTCEDGQIAVVQIENESDDECLRHFEASVPR